MRYFVTVGDRTSQVELDGEGVRVDGARAAVDFSRVGSTDVVSLIVDGTSYRALASRTPEGSWDLQMLGRRVVAEAIDERTRSIREMAGETGADGGPQPVKAPMPGLVVKVEVTAGERVRAGQGVLIVEAMKMENELRADRDALVAHVHVRPGEAVEKDQVLIDLAPLESESVEAS